MGTPRGWIHDYGLHVSDVTRLQHKGGARAGAGNHELYPEARRTWGRQARGAGAGEHVLKHQDRFHEVPVDDERPKFGTIASNVKHAYKAATLTQERIPPSNVTYAVASGDPPPGAVPTGARATSATFTRAQERDRRLFEDADAMAKHLETSLKVSKTARELKPFLPDRPGSALPTQLSGAGLQRTLKTRHR